MTWNTLSVELLWRIAWAVIPLAVIVAVLCKCLPLRPATRHTLWLVVLLGFIVPVVVPWADTDALLVLASSAVPEARESVEQSASDAEQLDPGLLHDEIVMREDDEDATWPLIVPAFDEIPIETNEANETNVAELFRGRNSGNSATKPEAAAPTEFHVPWWLPPALSLVERLYDSTSTGVDEDYPAPVLASAEIPDPESAAERPAPWVEHSASARPTAGTKIPAGVVDGTALAKPAPPARVGLVERLRGWWGPWLLGLVALRDAIGRLPMIPAHLWVLGIVALACWQLARLVGFRRRLRSAHVAPSSVIRMVDAASRSLGLRRAPRVEMVDDCVSPMISCGRRPRLILPTRLWDELDRVGRKAVVCHELAHLKRRDHWVFWIEMLVAALYWWHPVVWWARRRLHEEADLCCDAWVTWLMPKRRRAYAEALLRTKQFIGVDGRPAPAGGLGMTSVGAKRFARRLTMVMTKKIRPGASAPGLVVAIGLAFAGWLTVPVWAQPADGPDVLIELTPPTKVAAPAVVETPATPLLSAVGVSEAVALTPGPAMPGGVVFLTGDEDDDLADRLDELERQLDELSRQLALLRAISVRAPRAQSVPPMAAVPAVPPVQVKPPKPDMPTMVAPSVPRPSGRSGWSSTAPGMVWSEGATVMRSYPLPDGKYQALMKLMVRDDVPIVVSASKKPIEVHATRKQHKCFAAFVELIHPSGKAKDDRGETTKKSYKLPKGKLEALTELMVRRDVPILVSPGENHLGVYATPPQHKKFAAFIELIHPTKKSGGTAWGRAPGMIAGGRTGRADVPRAIGGGRAWSANDDEIIVRSYHLPKGKLEALSKLMLRNDVPIPVSQKDDCIEVHATAEQHRRFAAFVKLIHPSADVEIGDATGLGGTYDESLRLYTESQAPKRGAAGVARAYERGARAYARASERGGARARGRERARDEAAGCASDAAERYEEALKALQKARVDTEIQSQAAKLLGDLKRTSDLKDAKAAAEHALKLQKLHSRLQAEAGERVAQRQMLQAQVQAFEAQAQELEAQSQALAEQSQELQKQAQELRKQARESNDEGDEADDGHEARALEARARELRQQGQKLERKARELERKARQMEKKAERAELSVDEFDECVAQFEEAVDAASETLESR